MTLPHIQITSTTNAVSQDESGQEWTFTFEENGADRWDPSEGGELLEDFPMRFDDSFAEEPDTPTMIPVQFGSLVKSLSSRSIESPSQTPRSAPLARGLLQQSQSKKWSFRESFRWMKRNSGTTRFGGEEVRIVSSGKNAQRVGVAPVTSNKPQNEQSSTRKSLESSEHTSNTSTDVSDESSSKPRNTNEAAASEEDPIARLMAKLKMNADDQETNKMCSQWAGPSLLYDGDEEEEPNLDAQLSKVISLLR